MAPGRYIGRAYSLGNIATKRCAKRTQSMSSRSNNTSRVCGSNDTKSIDRRSVKKIRSHVFYSKKQLRQKPQGRNAESPVRETPRSSTNSKNQSKIKSTSWKRSDKTGAHVKHWRKKSPNWLTLQPVKQKSDLDSWGRLTSSEYRPGTLYSDVVFRGEIALPDPAILLENKEIDKEEFKFDIAQPSNGHRKFETRNKHYKSNFSNAKVVSLEKSPNDEDADEAFPPLLATNMMTPKSSNKCKGNIKIKPVKLSNYSLKPDDSTFNINIPPKDSVSYLEDKNNENTIKLQDSESSQEAQLLIQNECKDVIKSANSLEEENFNYSKNFCRRSEASINQIAYGLYVKSQYRQNADKILHFLNFPNEHINRPDEGEEWKHKYLPIMNVKLFDNFDEECGFGYSGFNLSRQAFLNYERGDQIFPRFSKHFDDDGYLALEHKAIASLESALRSSSN